MARRSPPTPEHVGRRSDASPQDGGAEIGPPRWVLRLLRWVSPGAGWGGTVAGDLQEEFFEDCEALGAKAARRRFLRRSLSVGAWGMMERVGGVLRAALSALTMNDMEETMGQWVQELRIAARGLRRSPGFTLVVVLTLAVGIGANTAIFSAVRGILLEPLRFPDSDRLVVVQHTAPGFDFEQIPLSEDTYALVRDEQRVFERMGAYRAESTVNLTGDGEPQVLDATTVSWDLPATLGVSFALGRGFTQEEDVPEGPAVAVLSHRLWRDAFGSDPAVLGRSIQLDGVPTNVVGVLAETLEVPGLDRDVWLPLRLDLENPDIGAFGLSSIARLQPDRTPVVAEANLAPVVEILEERMAGAEAYLGFIREGRLGTIVRPLKNEIVGDRRRPLWIVLGTVGFVLLIACANVANLVLVRAESRQREVAVRSALGARRWTLTRGFLAESLLLVLSGGALGLLLAGLSLPPLLQLVPGELPRAAQVGMDAGVLRFTAALVAVTTVLFGLFPSVRVMSAAAFGSLTQARGSTAGRERHRLRNVLVAGQTALALVLLIGSGLMLRSFDALRQVDLGFEAEGVLTFTVALPTSSYTSAAETAAFHQALLDRLSGLPTVTHVGAANYLPLSGGGSGTVHRAEDVPVDPGQLPPVVFFKSVSPGYFDALETELIAGRALERADHEQGFANAVISRSTAELFWPRQDPLGRRIGPNSGDSVSVWYTVVGVAEDVREENLSDPPRNLVYYPMVGPEGGSVAGARSMTYAVRTSGEPTALVAAARAAVWALDGDLPITQVQPFDRLVAQAASRTSFTVFALGLAAVVALLLGAIGLYGVLSYVVAQRTREIGVRIALGAPAEVVRRMVLRQGLLVAGAGIGVGLLGALALTRVLESLLFGTTARDPLTFAVTTLLLVSVAGLASYLPARRASTVDPMEALRAD